ncbi:MAG: serine/threonine protein kinase [Isosphaeraceae bacterium]
MSTVAWDPGEDERRDRLARILAEIDDSVRRGEPVDVSQWSARHPEFALEITQHFSHPQLDTPAEPHSPGVGDRVGDFELLERLGKGGEGSVFLARHHVTDHIVALKFVYADDEAAARIREETRALAGLRHPHIVPVYFFGEDRGICFYTMSFMGGGSLEEHLDVFQNDPDSAAAVVAQVARGVHHAHSRGILHLDLKPANVLLDESGQPHVSDFGLSRRLEPGARASLPVTNADSEAPGGPTVRWAELTRPQIRGTAPYMSPEMATGSATVVTTAADVYGLGAILYTLLTGRPPHQGESFQETLQSVLWDQPAAVRLLNRKVDRELDEVCRKCLMKDPARRYASADALANDLARWRRGEPTLAGRPTIGKHLRFWVRRHPLRVAAAAFAVLTLWLALSAGSVGAIHAANRREARRLAREVQTQLRMIEYEAEDVARDPQLVQAWHSGAVGSEAQTRALNDFLARVSRIYSDRFGLTGGNPLVNVLVMDEQGLILADSQSRSPAIGIAYPLRDYFRGLMDDPTSHPRNATVVSRAFQSRADGRYKLAVSTRVWDGERCLGLFVANITLGSRLVLLDMTEEPEGAAVVSPMDWTYFAAGQGISPRLPPFIAAFHRNYAQVGPEERPFWADPGAFNRLVEFDVHPERLEAEQAFRDGGVVDYARVGRTPLVVVLRQPYPWPARWVFNERLAIWTLAALLVLAAFAGVGIVWWRRTHTSRERAPAWLSFVRGFEREAVRPLDCGGCRPTVP